ncbi:MAG: SAM-dependent methyltransferase [Archangiaceae bacterium]|nr:SAM-dependent methyltransferase [Archangiaceae bacterium]
MRKGTASRTAKWVTYMRALANEGHTGVRGFADPVAKSLLDESWRTRLERTRHRIETRPENRLSKLSRSAADLMALRTLAIDGPVNAELSKGTRQLVILGAGLDARAWRLTALKDARVFEVDHPDTQAAKRANLADLAPTAKQVDFVAVDFESDRLDVALSSAGHDPRQPTLWVWEGVVMYLTTPAVRATLNIVSNLSAPGSVLVVNYHTQLHRGLVGLFLRFLGEPNRSAFTAEQLSAELAHAHFTVENDTGVADWQAAHGGTVAPYGAGRFARIAVGRRR